MSESIMRKLDEMQERCDAATEGPWQLGYGVIRDSSDSFPAIAVIPLSNQADGPDAVFLASARTDMPRLIAALKAVVEDHYPNGVDHECDCCPPVCACGHWEYPCPTVKDVKVALGVDNA